MSQVISVAHLQSGREEKCYNLIRIINQEGLGCYNLMRILNQEGLRSKVSPREEKCYNLMQNNAVPAAGRTGENTRLPRDRILQTTTSSL